jgi:hypothetical protein
MVRVKNRKASNPRCGTSRPRPRERERLARQRRVRVAGGKNILQGGRLHPILTFCALAALGLAGCMSTPHTTIAGKLNGSPFLIEAPKDGDLTGFDLTADSNGVIKVHIDHLAVKMNPEVIGQTGSAEAGIIQATANVASNITAAAVTAALKGN